MAEQGCIWLDRPIDFEIEGDVVRTVGYSAGKEFHFCMARATARNIAERLKWALDDADNATRAANVARLRPVHSATQ